MPSRRENQGDATSSLQPVPPPFSVSQYTTYPLSFEEDVALYRDLGVEGIEVCQEKLSADPGKARAQLALVRESGLRVTSVQPLIHSPFPHNDTQEGDPTDPAGRMARFRQTIDLFAESFPDECITFVAGGGIAPEYNFRLARRTAREVFAPLAEYAAERGTRIGFEHLHPILMNAYTFICTLDDARKLVADVDRPAFGLFLDAWHLWPERDLEERLAELAGLVFGVHLGDWPADEPRALGDRLIPGHGIIDLSSLLRGVHRSGYDGAYCLELFSAEHLPDSLWKADPGDVIRQGRAGFLDAWRAVVANGKGST